MENYKVKDSGKREEYPSGMRRDTQEGKPDYTLIDQVGLERVAIHLVKGAEKYGRDNWRKANSEEELTRFKSSALRHIFQWLRGDTDEDHMAAVVFNLFSAEYVKERLNSNSFTVKDGQFYIITVVSAPDQLAWYWDRVGKKYRALYKLGKFHPTGQCGWVEPEDVEVISEVT